jgi:hypothetical protein
MQTLRLSLYLISYITELECLGRIDFHSLAGQSSFYAPPLKGPAPAGSLERLIRRPS